jgi:hypothetical protein
MEKVYLEDNIFYINNFLSEQSFNSFLEMCIEYDSEFVYKEDFFLNRGSFNMHGLEIKESYRLAWEELTQKIELLCNNDVHSVGKRMSLTKFKKYDPVDNNKELSFGRHSDDYGFINESSGVESDTTAIFLGLNYYINDDYDGGEVCYPKKGIRIKPNRNSILCHPGSEEYEHEVTQIFNADKYSFPCFAINNKLL